MAIYIHGSHDTYNDMIHIVTQINDYNPYANSNE
jgi:hypothetical protein